MQFKVTFCDNKLVTVSHNYKLGQQKARKTHLSDIIFIQCGKPFEENGKEFITISVKGQSFMLHQIRKMIGEACS